MVYVDGFNFYYRALKKTPHRWIDLNTLVRRMMPNSTIVGIKYYTALVSSRPHNPDQPQRQQLYLRALRTIPNLEIHLGHYLMHEVPMAKVVPAGQPAEMVKVYKTEEKGSDVNLATHMVHDAHMDRFDVAVLISNDSDLVAPVRIINGELNKKVVLLAPDRSRPARALLGVVSSMKQIREGALRASQFPETLTDAQGTFARPVRWR